MKKYEKTHSWINFKLDLKELDYKIWMALGEIQSKCIHIAGVPLKPSVEKELNSLYLVKGVMATTAIEGNTLTEQEIRAQLEKTLKLPPSKEYLAQETENIINLFEEIDNSIKENKNNNLLKPEKIAYYNKKILHNIPKADEAVQPGIIRDYSTVVGNYRCPPYQDCEYLLSRLCEWLNSGFQDTKGMKIAVGLLKAITAHLYFVWIHPFGDGNGRTARMLEYEILRRSGVPSPSAHLLSNHYNQTRSMYYLKLNEASKDKLGVIKFIEYAIEGFLDGLKLQLKTIRFSQWDVAWINYVHECFSGQNSPSDVRKRELILEISQNPKGCIPLSELKYLSAKIAELYATKAQRVLYRDIDDLEKMYLLEKQKNEEGISCVRATKENILAFLPVEPDDPLVSELF